MKIGVIGSSGAIGSALCAQFLKSYPGAELHCFSSKATQAGGANYHKIDYQDESSISEAAHKSYANAPFDIVVVAVGQLHNDQGISPEKSLRDLSAENLHHIFHANTVIPTLCAKHFLPLLAVNKRAVFAAVSARVGSISDNRLGGWYSYRASKAALNMVIKNAAIEMGRRHKEMVVVGLHPGTVDSSLSKPFQANVAEGKLFAPEYSARCLVSVLQNLSAKESGKCFAWDGSEIDP